MASADRQRAGLVPVNYIKVIKPNSGTNGDEQSVKEKENKMEQPATSIADLDKFYVQEL